MSTAISAAKALPFIDTSRCTGCGWCVGVCPTHVLSLDMEAEGDGWGRKRSVLHTPAHCTGCGLCAVRCPFDAIGMVKKPQDRANKEASS